MVNWINKDQFQATLRKCDYQPPQGNDLDAKYTGLVNAIVVAQIGSRTELAMFLANVYHESGGLQFREENIDPNRDYEYTGGNKYHGRGYIQLTHKYNYAAASKDLLRDETELVKHPERVCNEEDLAWKVTGWYWGKNV